MIIQLFLKLNQIKYYIFYYIYEKIMSYYMQSVKIDYTANDTVENIVSNTNNLDSTQDVLSGDATLIAIDASATALNVELTAIIDTLRARVLLLEQFIVNTTY